MIQAFSAKGKLSIAVILLAAAVIFVAAIGIFANAPAEAAEEKAEKKTINVSGQSKVTASPDFATISLGVVTEDKDAKAAQKANAGSMEKVIGSIKALGIADEDIQTSNYSISPVYSYNKETGESMITGYTVNNTVNVTVRDLSKVGSVIDAAAESGVNTSSSIRFGLSNYEDYYNEALKNAVLAADRKAKTIADALGVKLKGAVTVNESGGYSPLLNYAVYDMKAEGVGASTPIQAGQLEITAYVNIVYEY
ncbi:MAG TPA: SIMPL domain-containing protein [Clostridiales bacterium]|nr:SIMPL domain-containing protein [Clostridiales bacterium]HPV02024.1 SIMPL domain-containing protein [Clostridiales bacterium]